MAQQLSTNTFGCAKWIVDATLSNGTHSAIATALTSASSGDTIFMRPGTYAENLTLKAGVNLTAFGSDSSSNGTGKVIISGTCTLTTAGSVTISGIQLQTNSAAAIAVTGSAASIVNLQNCYLNFTNNSGITFSSSSASAQINVNNCFGDLGTTGINLFAHSSAGTLAFNNSIFTNIGASTTANTVSAGLCVLVYSKIANPITTSGTGAISIQKGSIDTSGQNVTALTHGGSGSSGVSFSYFSSGSASAISISQTLNIFECEVFSSNTNAITGAGTCNYAGVTYSGSSSLNNTTTLAGLKTHFGGISFDGGVNNLTAFTQGTFTATMRGSSTAGTFTYDANTQIGRYQKVGRIVNMNFRADWSSAGTAAGNLQAILPFTAVTATGDQTVGMWSAIGRALASGAATETEVRIGSADTIAALNALNTTTGVVANVAVVGTGSACFNISYEI